MRFRAVDKNKNIPTGRVPIQVVLHQTAQPVKPFAHIGNSAVNKITERAAKGQHPALVNYKFKAAGQMKLQLWLVYGQWFNRPFYGNRNKPGISFFKEAVFCLVFFAPILKGEIVQSLA